VMSKLREYWGLRKPNRGGHVSRNVQNGLTGRELAQDLRKYNTNGNGSTKVCLGGGWGDVRKEGIPQSRKK